MTTTGELRAIVEELALVDVGDAASYLGEDATNEALFSLSDADQAPLLTTDELAALGIFGDSYLLK